MISFIRFLSFGASVDWSPVLALGAAAEKGVHLTALRAVGFFRRFT
jgi:hypothetical protein